MNKSESIGALAAALAKAQSGFPAIPKDKEVIVKSDKGSYKFRYAPLESITGAIRPVLAANGLAFSQSVSGDSLTTMILHSSGEWLQSDPIPIKVASGSAQALGSGITYARRYSLTCAFGIVADEDDDGNAADGNHAVSSPVQPTKTGWTPTPDEEKFLSGEIDMIRAKIENEGALAAAIYFYREPGLDEEEKLWVWNKLSKSEKDAVRKNKNATTSAASGSAPDVDRHMQE